ncbi:MAG: hypothetical protein HKN25_10735 [Pyrinomonadaceae bacterium]|nr:hypothetical protein [Pyrinomonadaceae bacterium]
MRYLEVVKRIVPFIAALVLGVFVASFFVSISAPTVRVDRSWKSSKHRDYNRLQRENRCLKRANKRLKRERRKILEVEREFDRVMELVPPPAPMAPAPPVAPDAPPPPPKVKK